MPVLLLVGEDEILLRTRAAVLKATGADIVISDSASAMAMASVCDLLVLCHSVPERVATGLIAAFRSRWPFIPILQMTSLRTWEVRSEDDDVEAIPSADPARLVKRSSELLGTSAKRRPTARELLHRTVRIVGNIKSIATASGC